MAGYIRTDVSAYIIDSIYLIPTIEVSKWARGIEINLFILCLCIYFTISYIKEENYEP